MGSFREQLNAVARRNGSLVCVGLDPDVRKFPPSLASLAPKQAIVRFNRAIIDATKDLVCAYKPNLGFYVAYGIPGLEALAETKRMIPAGMPVILDCKAGDLAVTSDGYARGFFETWNFDAVTVNPYLGEDALEPFLSAPGKGVIVLSKTSNPGSGDLQDLYVETGEGREPVYLNVARRAAVWNDRYAADVGLVVGATYPDQLKRVRKICPTLPILLPGVGAQAGDVDASVKAGVDADGYSLIVSSSRGIIYASNGEDFADRARDAALALQEATRRAVSNLAVGRN
ncbi:MAG: orotidine-5'-phosphate decarboxylase [Thermomicrobiales bacterium]